MSPSNSGGCIAQACKRAACRPCNLHHRHSPCAEWLCKSRVQNWSNTSGGRVYKVLRSPFGDLRWHIRPLYRFPDIPFVPGRETGVIAPVTEKLWRGALKRRHIFASKDEAFTAYGSRAFKHFDKTVLRAYVNHGFKVTPCKFTLASISRKSPFPLHIPFPFHLPDNASSWQLHIPFPFHSSGIASSWQKILYKVLAYLHPIYNSVSVARPTPSCLDYLSYSGGRSVELKCSRQCEALVFALVERMAAGYFDALADIRCPVVVGAGAGTFGGAGMADRSEKVAAQLGNGRLERCGQPGFPLRNALSHWRVLHYLI